MLKIYATFDDKAGVFSTPFFQINDGVARRSFATLARDPSSVVSQYPNDYHLYLLGEYDDTAGRIFPLEMPQFVAHAIEFTNTALVDTQSKA